MSRCSTLPKQMFKLNVKVKRRTRIPLEPNGAVCFLQWCIVRRLEGESIYGQRCITDLAVHYLEFQERQPLLTTKENLFQTRCARGLETRKPRPISARIEDWMTSKFTVTLISKITRDVTISWKWTGKSSKGSNLSAPNVQFKESRASFPFLHVMEITWSTQIQDNFVLGQAVEGQRHYVFGLLCKSRGSWKKRQ